MKNKIIAVIVAVLIIAGIAGLVYISIQKEDTKSDSTSKTSNTTGKKSEQNKLDFKKSAEKQMAKPESGETIATIKVKNFGDIKIKFFEESAPKAVENFITHAKDGYYDGTTFHRVMEEFMIQGGDPEGNGTGGESIWGNGFEEEIDLNLVPYRGALCMASRGTGTKSIGSQFFIVQANYSDDMGNILKQNGYPEDLLEQYKNYGGYLSLYMGYTVFGQVFEGMDVVDKIAKVEKNISSTGEESEPKEPVVVETIEITEN